ncbi:MAG: ATP-binding protein [Roseburia sp.]
MNIREAKEELKATVQAYLRKDENGIYRIPAIRQRPMLLIGPPGIGKTQIMEQIARECRIGLVAYTITHHTRQSAVGLPFIREESFQGKNYSVTEYTMSEIIASVYRKMEETGLSEGILFIDEINCVSETLAPTMLQFLQCKTFGNQAVPEGWIIVAAGNPPEYNKSVRDFDMVTLDRVRYLEITADYPVWRSYARERQLHGAVLSYLELRPKNFYRVETDVDGMQFVTARGWEDLSSLMQTYEELGLLVEEDTVYEFLHHREVAEDAAAYFELYRKYQDDYGIEEILSGRVRPEIYARIYEAAFDERISVTNLLLDGMNRYFSRVAEEKARTDNWYAFLQEFRRGIENAENITVYYDSLVEKRADALQKELQEGFSTRKEAAEQERFFALLRENRPQAGLEPKDAFDAAKQGFDGQRKALETAEAETAAALECAFDFMENAFAMGQELLVFVTELTMGSASAAFLAEHPCERYLKYNKELLVGTRRAELLKELER